MRIATLIAALLVPFALQAAQDPAAALARLAPGEWLEYRVAANDPRTLPCCFDFDGRRAGERVCRLKDGIRSFGTSSHAPPPPPDAALRVLLRRGGGTFDRVVAVGTSCAVDAQGERVVALTDVDPAASVRLLAQGSANEAGDRRGMAMHAIANHAGDEATAALANIARRSSARAARHDAWFWLAAERGAAGLALVRDALATEQGGETRRHLVFCVSESRAPGAPELLMSMARTHADPDVRGQAMFWAAQRRLEGIEAVVSFAIDNDSSRSVRKQAIFALSQLPHDRAIPALAALVASDRPREIRREALFWLAQTDDDAVLPVFDELLAPN